MTDRLRTGVGLVVVAVIGWLIAAGMPDGGESAAGMVAALAGLTGIIGLGAIAWELLRGSTEAQRD